MARAWPAPEDRAVARDEVLEALVARAASGDDGAFDALVNRFRDSVYALALAVLGDPHEAADAAQEGFIRAYRGLKALRDPARFQGWLRSIVLNQAREARRARSRRRRLASSTEPRALDRMPAEPRRATIGGGLSETWSVLLDRLPPSYREILVLRFVSGLSYREIAGLLGIGESLVGVRLLRAKEALRRALPPDEGGETP